jgi:hypothetical protein
MRPITILTFALAGGLLCACQKQLEAPGDKGVCWHLAQGPNGQARFNVLAQNQPDLEHCAAELEKMRLNFRALGSTQTEVTGAYQTQFLFLQPEGVFTAQSYDGQRYLLMVRTGDGRLAVPGAMPMQDEEQK